MQAINIRLTGSDNVPLIVADDKAKNIWHVHSADSGNQCLVQTTHRGHAQLAALEALVSEKVYSTWSNKDKVEYCNDMLSNTDLIGETI